MPLNKETKLKIRRKWKPWRKKEKDGEESRREAQKKEKKKNFRGTEEAKK